MKQSENPIGLFDSGIGGTSIWKEIHLLLPNESTIYLSDSKNAPYGNKDKEQIIEFAIKNTEYLLNKNCKIIIVACNTATTNAIDILRNRYKIPFIGIVPAIKPAALKTKTNTIGILATKGTLNSKLFEKTSSTLSSELRIIEQVGEGLVNLIEEGDIRSKDMKKLLRTYLKPMIKANVDHIVLGCTHYPYLKNQIQDIVGPAVVIIDSGNAVALQTKNVLESKILINTQKKIRPFHNFFINKKATILEKILELYKSEIEIKEIFF
ncbi:MAG TPA: glutamate racemase [Tenacibaculum sp.]|nr:glutamate racemase [Tenacibaculum sp.]